MNDRDGRANFGPPCSLRHCDGEQNYETGFHFQISEPRIRPNVEYRQVLAFHLLIISDRVAVDDYVLESDDGTLIAKVYLPPRRSELANFAHQVRLRLSDEAIRQNTSLESAIKTMCRDMMASGEAGRRNEVEYLSGRSVWGITAISPMFQTFWTASFFNEMLSTGSRILESRHSSCFQLNFPIYVSAALWFA